MFSFFFKIFLLQIPTSGKGHFCDSILFLSFFGSANWTRILLSEILTDGRLKYYLLAVQDNLLPVGVSLSRLIILDKLVVHELKQCSSYMISNNVCRTWTKTMFCYKEACHFPHRHWIFVFLIHVFIYLLFQFLIEVSFCDSEETFLLQS